MTKQLKFLGASCTCASITQFKYFKSVPWLQCFHTSARGEVEGSVAEDVQLSPPLVLIVHVPQDFCGTCQYPRSAAMCCMSPLTVAVPVQSWNENTKIWARTHKIEEYGWGDEIMAHWWYIWHGTYSTFVTVISLRHNFICTERNGAISLFWFLSSCLHFICDWL